MSAHVTESFPSHVPVAATKTAKISVCAMSLPAFYSRRCFFEYVDIISIVSFIDYDSLLDLVKLHRGLKLRAEMDLSE